MPIGAFRFLSARNAHDEARRAGPGREAGGRERERERGATDSIAMMILSLSPQTERERERAAASKQTDPFYTTFTVRREEECL